MNTEAMAYKDGEVMDYTPSSAVTAGQVLLIAGQAVIAITDIAAGVLGAVQRSGIIKVAAAAVAGQPGDNLWWDEDGNPVDGTAGSGAATTIVKDGNIYLGCLTATLTTTAGEACVLLNVKPTSGPPAWVNRVHEVKSDNYTVDAEDVGKVLHVTVDAKTITLPATAAGLTVTVVNDGADGAVAVNISPQAADKIMGPDLAGVDNKDLINTKSTAKKNDYVVLVADGVNGWWVTEKRGTWAAEA